MQDVYDLGKPNGVDRTICIPGVILHNFKHPGATKSLQRFRRAMLAANLGDIECVSDLAHDAVRKSKEVILCTSDPTQRPHAMCLIAVLT
jgi:hypothetical protein